LAAIQQSANLAPLDAAAHSNLGITLQEMGRLDEAESSLRRAIALDADFAEAHNNLGITLIGQERVREAEASLRRAIALKPDYAEAHNNLGNALKDSTEATEAEACYERAILLAPDYAEAHSNLASLYQSLGRLREIVSEDQKVRKIQGEEYRRLLEEHAEKQKSNFGFGDFE
jgi:Flp pilus assembly protein TadD